MPVPPSDPLRPQRDLLRPHNPLVAHRWLAGGIAAVILGALLALYMAIALLFWQGHWQLLFHPSNVVTADPGTLGIPYQEVRFGRAETGQAELSGWWIPAGGAGTARVLLYLHGGRGSLADALPDLAVLHALGCDVFAFDPRGYGRSRWQRPSERRWLEDGSDALAYLASVRHAAPQDVVVAGRDLGAAVAAELTLRHPGPAALIMIDPRPGTLGLLEEPRWTHMLPVRLLAADRFDPAPALASPAVAKLFLVPPGAVEPAYIRRAAGPASVVRAEVASPLARDAMRRFLAALPAPARVPQ